MGAAFDHLDAQPALGGGPGRPQAVHGIGAAFKILRVVMQIGADLDQQSAKQGRQRGQTMKLLCLTPGQGDADKHRYQRKAEGLGPDGQEPILHGLRGNLLKSTGRFSTKASRPSWASSVK